MARVSFFLDWFSYSLRPVVGQGQRRAPYLRRRQQSLRAPRRPRLGGKMVTYPYGYLWLPLRTIAIDFAGRSFDREKGSDGQSGRRDGARRQHQPGCRRDSTGSRSGRTGRSQFVRPMPTLHVAPLLRIQFLPTGTRGAAANGRRSTRTFAQEIVSTPRLAAYSYFRAAADSCSFRATAWTQVALVSARKRGSHGQKGRREPDRGQPRRARGRDPMYGRSADADRPTSARAMHELPYAALPHIQLLRFGPGGYPGTPGRVLTHPQFHIVQSD